MEKWERRDAKKAAAKKMKVSGRGFLTIDQTEIERKRSDKRQKEIERMTQRALTRDLGY